MIRSLLAPVCFAALVASGCDFFRELESLPGTEASGTIEPSGTGAGEACPKPEQCIDQDRMRICDTETGTEVEVDCVQVCGAYLNISCIALDTRQRACWCAEVGKQNVLECASLEACILECGPQATSSCGNTCFRRATAETARLFGGLMFCAEQTCRDTCNETPSACGTCMAAAREGHYDCGVARGLCDQDTNDDPAWPPTP
ncbi:MAG: hypothetical protein V3V08_15950 [Nannocystaceae bacterium]